MEYERIISLHQEMRELAERALGRDIVVGTVISINDTASGQWQIFPLGLPREKVASRLRLCADLLAPIEVR